MRTSRKSRVAGGTTAWVLLLGVLLVAIGVLVARKFMEPRPAPVAVAPPTPEPATPVPATPPPVVVATPTPAPPPVVAATPTPVPVATPPPLDAAKLAQTPALWPAQVALVAPKSFPVMINGRLAGEAKLPAGTVLRVLRVNTESVEVDYQSQRQTVPLGMTDALSRALATYRQRGSDDSLLAAPPTTAAATSLPPAFPAAAPGTAAVTSVPPPAAPAPGSAWKIGDHLTGEVTRIKKSRVEGGDWDDKKDRIVLKVKVTNLDPAQTMEGLKGEVFILGESILDRSAARMLGKKDFTCSLPPRGSRELMTEEIETTYDTTGVRFGYRYEGWVLTVRDSDGKLVMEKSSSPTMAKSAEKIAALEVNSDFDRRTFTPRKKK